MKFVSISLVLLAVFQCASSAPNINLRCTKLFTDESNPISFDLNLVKPTDVNNPLKLNNGITSAQFLPCSGIQAKLVPAEWKCQNTFDQNQVYFFDGTTCYALTTDASIATFEFSKDEKGKATGVSITYDNSKVPAETKSKLYSKNLKIIVKCDNDVKDSDAVWSYNLMSLNYLEFTTSAKAGCGTSYRDLLDFFNNNKYVFGLAFIAIGILFTFFGRRFFSITLILIGFLIGFLAVAGLAYSISFFQGADTKKVVVLMIISVLLGALVAWIFNAFKVVSTMAAVGALFFFIANAILRLYLTRYITTTMGEFAVVIVVVIIGVLFGYVYSKQCIMFSTAFGGSFLVVYAVGTLTKTLDSPAVINERVRNGERVVGWLLYRWHTMYMVSCGSFWALVD